MINLELVLFAAAAKLRQSCPTLCDPIDYSPPGSSVPGILQTKTLEWAAVAFSGKRSYQRSNNKIIGHSRKKKKAKLSQNAIAAVMNGIKKFLSAKCFIMRK